VLHYQPIVVLADAHVVGHEALVRWMHPTRGLLSPGDFLDVAEDSGLITAIGAQVLDQVAAMLAECPDLPGPISVNVSACPTGCRGLARWRHGHSRPARGRPLPDRHRGHRDSRPEPDGLRPARPGVSA